MRIPRVLLAYASLACVGIGLTASLASAQTSSQDPNGKKDPFLLPDPSGRVTANMPVPYGFVVSGRYAFSSATDIGSKPGLTAGADVYYDTWQIGYHVEDYGNVVRIGTRSIGRDWWSGLFFEVGSGKGTLGDSVHTFPYSLFGVGMQYNYAINFKGFQSGVNLAITVGSSSYDAGTAAGGYPAGSSIYFSGAFGFVYRIPIQTTSLTLGLSGFALLRPSTGDSPNSGSGIAFNAAYAFNFQN